MQTIQEESEESSDEEKLIRREKQRESLSSLQPRNRTRSVGNGWVEYLTPSGRLYYYNADTKEKSWKPPRKTASQSTQSQELQKQKTIGKILRTGVLKTAKGDAKKLNWVKSFVVLTEFYIVITTVVGGFRKYFHKKNPHPCGYQLKNAEVFKKSSKIYTLKTTTADILFKSKNPTTAESWYQTLMMVVKELNVKERASSVDLGASLRKEVEGAKLRSVSLSDFGRDTIDRSSCLSDFFGVKYPAPPGWINIYDSESEQFCYVNCITGRKWFWAMTDDGHPYFYEEGFGRKAWLLPSIYLDVNSIVLEDIRKSLGSWKSLQSETKND